MKKYVVWILGKRKGEFEFCSSTQEHWCNSLEEAIEEIVNRDFDWVDGEKEGYDVPDEDYIIYEINLKKIMNGAQAKSIESRA